MSQCSFNPPSGFTRLDSALNTEKQSSKCSDIIFQLPAHQFDIQSLNQLDLSPLLTGSEAFLEFRSSTSNTKASNSIKYKIYKVDKDRTHVHIIHGNQLIAESSTVHYLKIEPVLDGAALDEDGANITEKHIVKIEVPQQPPAEYMKYRLKPIGSEGPASKKRKSAMHSPVAVHSPKKHKKSKSKSKSKGSH